MNNYFNEEDKKMLLNEDTITRTKIIIEKIFKDKVDKAGTPYINHLETVASYFTKEDEIVTALLHDIVEDTEVTLEDLEELGYNKEVLEGIDLLTRKDTSYDEYINNLINSNNITAKKVKISDLLNNMNINRIENPTTEDFSRIKNKYIKTYTKVLNNLEKNILK